MSERASWHSRAAEIAASAKVIWGTIAFITASLAAGWLWLSENYAPRNEVKEIVATGQASTTPCLAFPDNQHLDRMRVRHEASAALPGQEASITWYELERLRECGAPCVTGWIINGDGRERQVDLSITADRDSGRRSGPCPRGKALPIGRQPPLKYGFDVPLRAAPGCAVFFVRLKFDEHPDRIESPWVPFTILNPDGSMPDTAGEACA